VRRLGVVCLNNVSWPGVAVARGPEMQKGPHQRRCRWGPWGRTGVSVRIAYAWLLFRIVLHVL